MTSPAGLTSREARRRLEEFGPNAVAAKPSAWVFASSVADIAIVVILAVSGTLMEPLPWRLVVAACGAAAAFAVLLDQVKVPILSVFKIE